jgi:hypothetical protein
MNVDGPDFRHLVPDKDFESDSFSLVLLREARMLSRFLLAPRGLVGLDAPPTTSRDHLLLGNLPSNDNVGAGVTESTRRAVQFTMGRQIRGLVSIELRLDYASGSPVLELRDHQGDSGPGPHVLARFHTPPLAEDRIQTYRFFPTQAFTLQANTSYWLYVYGGNPRGLGWFGSLPIRTPTGGAATVGLSVVSFDCGETWPVQNMSLYPGFQINGTTGLPTRTPEWSALALLVLGVSCLGKCVELF